MNQSVRVMRALLLFLFLVLSWNSGFTQEKYFHDLRGMEDSTGTTHLFYRFNINEQIKCSEENGGYTITHYSYNIYHFDASTFEDSVFFRNFEGDWCLPGYFDRKVTFDYHFINNQLDEFVYLESSGTNDYSAPSLYHSMGAILSFPFPIFVKTESDHYLPPINFTVSKDSIYLQLQGQPRILPLSLNSELWPDFKDNADSMYAYFDSVTVPRELAGIHPTNESLFFFFDDEHYLYRSENYTNEYELVSENLKFWKLLFIEGSSRMYALITDISDGNYIPHIGVSNTYGKSGSWVLKQFPDLDNNVATIYTDSKDSRKLYVTDGFKIYESNDYASSYELILELDSGGYMPDRIAGLYKKPESDLLYILTREKLQVLNTENKALYLLNNHPINNEYSINKPTTITLHQNYPNPFNPSTVISYQLTGNSMVSLRVFDALGREVAVLVDELKSAGNHQVTFDATGLASGVYYYVLNADEQTLTKKLTLIK